MRLGQLYLFIYCESLCSGSPLTVPNSQEAQEDNSNSNDISVDSFDFGALSLALFFVIS